MTLFLTWFLVLGGAFVLFCSIKNYDWYFRLGGIKAQRLLKTIGRKSARILYIVVGASMLGWGVYRVANPPAFIDPSFLDALSRPQEIELTKDEATGLLEKSEKIRGLELGPDKKWSVFWTILEPDDAIFPSAREAAERSTDFSKGFHLPKTDVGPFHVGGRIVYYDADYVICDNFLFSKHPLESAEFVMVLCDRELSTLPESEGLPVFFARKASAAFAALTEF